MIATLRYSTLQTSLHLFPAKSECCAPSGVSDFCDRCSRVSAFAADYLGKLGAVEAVAQGMIACRDDYQVQTMGTKCIGVMIQDCGACHQIQQLAGLLSRLRSSHSLACVREYSAVVFPCSCKPCTCEEVRLVADHSVSAQIQPRGRPATVARPECVETNDFIPTRKHH